jgi:uncharacterized membrane protein YjjB (DUF3815 family)
MNVADLLHQTVCGGLAAAGFGVLFNIRFRPLPWCAASGALALAVRTLALEHGWSLEGASFMAALAVGFAVQLLPSLDGVTRNALHVAACIPMIPGAFAAKAILGLFAITHPAASSEALITAMDNVLRVILTVGSLGTGLAIPILLVRSRKGTGR